MLIQALSEYYDILSKNGKITSEMYSKIGLHFLVCISEQGEIIDIIDVRIEDTNNKKSKLIPRDEILPNIPQFSGTRSKLIEYRPEYLFGLNYDKNSDKFTTEDKTNKARMSHDSFVKANIDFIKGINTPVVNAYRKFIETFSPEDEINNKFLGLIKKDYGTSRFGFCLNDSSTLLHEDKEIQNAWEGYYNSQKDAPPEKESVCAISGKITDIARVHNKLKGFNSMGSVLSGVKEAAMCSYTNEQGYNSNISKEIMEKYTTAFNYVVSNQKNRTNFDDITLIHFAMSDKEIYEDIFNFSINEKMDESETSDAIKNVLADARNAVITKERINFSNLVDENVQFYIIGLKPNSSRLAIKFVYKQKFGDIIENITKHQIDMQITDDSRPISFWQIQKELKSPVSKNANVDPSLVTKLMQSVLYGYNYPEFLLRTIILRIKTDSDTDKSKFIKFNNTRISIIKACINRSLRLNEKKEEITMSLNLENTNEAYLCGRLFAVLENLQTDASGGNINKTIKDTYFSSACSKPSTIFPKLLKLSVYHMSNAKYGKNREYEIKDIVSKLNNEFPDTLSLKEQGKFIIGYYQQSQYRFNKEKEKEVEIEEEK